MTRVAGLLRLGLVVPLRGTTLLFGPLWLVILPLLVWGVRSFYVPVTAPSLSGTAMWIATIIIVIGVIATISAHACGHVLIATLMRSRLPRRLALYPGGDAAHVWPSSTSLGVDALVMLGGIATNLVIAGVAYLVWDRQLGTLWNTVTLFLALENLGMALLNLSPIFPNDYGRLILALLNRGRGNAANAIRLTMGLAWLTVAALGAWAAFLYLQQLRFSTATAGITLAVMLVMALELVVERPAGSPAAVASEKPVRPWTLRDYVLVAAAIVVLSPAQFLLLPTNLGMQAPGPAASVEPMVNVAPGHSYPVNGSFILTTIIPQAPIVVGEWLYAQYDHGILIKPAREIVQPNTSSQQLALQGFRDLQESEKTAIVVGLKMAGFDASLTYTGARIISIQPTSKANGVLRLGDEIVALNGQPVGAPADVSHVLSSITPPPTTVQIEVRRGDQDLTFTIPLTPDSSGTPRIGISIDATGDRLDLPFHVSITPQKIEGGPSAGLMFALTVYNAVTSNDLTGGHRIAGTGTLDLNGQVGPIGGVHAKVAAAERAGAEYFLVPTDNYADAQAAADHIKVVQVTSFTDALKFLQSLSPKQ